MQDSKVPNLFIREKLIKMSALCQDLQEYVLGLRSSAPVTIEAESLFGELLRLETRLAVISEILYQDEMSLTIERAIDRLMNKGVSRI